MVLGRNTTVSHSEVAHIMRRKSIFGSSVKLGRDARRALVLTVVRLRDSFPHARFKHGSSAAPY